MISRSPPASPIFTNIPLRVPPPRTSSYSPIQTPQEGGLLTPRSMRSPGMGSNVIQVSLKSRRFFDFYRWFFAMIWLIRFLKYSGKFTGNRVGPETSDY